MVNDNISQNEEKLDLGWQNAQALRNSLKSGVRDDDQSHHRGFTGWLRNTLLFSRRKRTSLVNRVVWMLLVWSVIVYLLGVAGLWWSSSKVIEDNFSQQATDWVAKLDELGTPLYAANDEYLFQSIEEHVRRFPEISYLRYYEADKNTIIAQYSSEKLSESNVRVAELSPAIIEQLRLNIDSEQPVFIQTADENLSLVQVAAPIVTRSIRSDSMLDFDLDENLSETYKIIGYLELGLDFSHYRDKLIENIFMGSVGVAILFLVAAIFGRILIKRSLKPLTNMRKPLEQLANGEIDVHVKGEGDEEIVAIANALNTTITALKSRDEELRQLANYDALTGLLNKHNFDIQLKQEVQRVADENDSSALLFIDLDQFKHVNDNLGHAAGDRLLKQVADLLKNRIRTDDVISRFGGDEFTIIARSIRERDAQIIAESILKSMQQFVFVENGQAFNIYCSIGVAIMDGGNFTAEEFFSQADMSCFHAKSEGRNRYHMFDLGEQEELRKSADISWSKRISDAIQNDYFTLFFQPVVSLNGDTSEHYEVLLRMVMENDEIIHPNAFLPAAERLGVAIDIDYWVVRNALRKLSEFKADGRDVYLGINLSGRIFESTDLVEKIKRYISQYNVETDHIIFEITEQTAVRYIDRASKTINELVALGCRFALDDFGVGFSSFNYLKRLPVEILKIDGDFISDMVKDPVDQAMVQSMIQIAKTLGKKTTAEYVQDAATLEMLKSFGADFVQGYYLGKPVKDINRNSYAKVLERLNTNVVTF
ncbi:diguanylate cyclase/phosphodiesterase (GGDEF & EAL domains) with PAS/PAC sensor(s) [hydrothermal vent metagenome]|uniref:Diguanylate cyclase/phosphodiesterase (GGDEF & EAL domains) with PAS/PAC sensor(S) n=1 Tax=hydrothermal vent metagenome TaxID=652676 RepID=A0A3B0XND2_9ZZZZ